MSENTIPVGPEVDMFDPDTFVSNSALSGKTGVVLAAEFRKGYADGKFPDATTAKLVISSPELEKPRVNFYGCGGAEPAVDKDGRKVQAQQGPYLTGSALDKKSTIADFIINLKASGFDMGLLRSKGFHALGGANFLWKSVERRAGGKDTKPYDMPAEFLGFVDITDLAKLTAQPAVVNVDESATAVAIVQTADVELAAILQAKLIEAVSEAGGSLPKAQLSIKIGPKINGMDGTAKAKAFSLLLNEQFLASVPGMKYDNKILTIDPIAPPK